jgi:hypothetical protein
MSGREPACRCLDADTTGREFFRASDTIEYSPMQAMPDVVDFAVFAGLIIGVNALRNISLTKLQQKTVQKGLAVGAVSLLWALATYAPSVFVSLGFPERGIVAAQSLRIALNMWSANELLSQWGTFIGIFGTLVAWVGSRYLERYFNLIFWIFIGVSILTIIGSLPPF